ARHLPAESGRARAACAAPPARAHLAGRAAVRRLTGRGAPMEEPMDFEIERENEQLRVNAWRVEQLARLGGSAMRAVGPGDSADWHEVARLVQQGCPPDLALEISR